MRKLTTIFLLLTILVCPALSLDVREGLIRVRIDDLTGRIALYRLGMLSGSRYEALVFDMDPRTSSLSISIDGRRVKLGDSQEYRAKVRRVNKGAEVEFSSPVASVIQRVEFVRSSESRLHDTFKISYIVRNISARDFRFALRQIWDTRLGEKSGVHFATDSVLKFDEERTFSGDLMVPYVVTPGESASMALLLEGFARPDVVTLANWKRLSDATWAYGTLMKGFSLAPYSLNDSAMGLYWNDVIVKAGNSVTFVSYFLTGGEGKDFLRLLKEKRVQIIGESTPIQPAVNAPVIRTPLNLEALRTLLKDLDFAIENIDTISEEEINRIIDQLNEFEAQGETEQ
jgi:hypothetical protein